MRLKGQRIHIVGSVGVNANEEKLCYMHSLISELTLALALEGASFIIPFGKEPHLNDDDDKPSIIFDWTVAESVHRALMNNQVQPSGPNGRLVFTLATSKSEEHIPNTRRKIFNELREKQSIEFEFIQSGWNAGSVRRQRLSQLGDILICISGGEGVEHLAMEYSSKGKPVIPFDINLGSSSKDGSGGASRLFESAQVNPADFVQVIDEVCAADLINQIKIGEANKPKKEVVNAVMKLIVSLMPPLVFYVRLLNKTHEKFPIVENFFRSTVDPFVKELGYSPCEMGMGINRHAWMNQAIFNSLHHSAVIFADLTGLRPNCFLELGYAFGNKQRTIVSACEGTSHPFDISSFEIFQWSSQESIENQISKLQRHWERNINIPPLVHPKEAK